MNAKEREEQSQTTSNSLQQKQEKQGLLFHITLELQRKWNKGGTITMEHKAWVCARKELPFGAQRWINVEGQQLSGCVVSPLCAETRGELWDSDLVVRSCGAENVWSVLGDSGLHYGAESQGSPPLCQKARGLIRSQLHYECLPFPKGSLNRRL